MDIDIHIHLDLNQPEERAMAERLAAQAGRAAAEHDSDAGRQRAARRRRVRRPARRLPGTPRHHLPDSGPPRHRLRGSRNRLSSDYKTYQTNISGNLYCHGETVRRPHAEWKDCGGEHCHNCSPCITEQAIEAHLNVHACQPAERIAGLADQVLLRTAGRRSQKRVRA
jgi:hypothetical protein